MCEPPARRLFISPTLPPPGIDTGERTFYHQRMVAREESPEHRSALLDAMVAELRRKLEPLERAGCDLRHVEVLLKRDGKQITSDVTVRGGGFTPVTQTPTDVE